MADDVDVTVRLNRWAEGDAEAFRSLIPLVYAELKRLAEHYLRNERAEHTLQPTALVHEAYLRLSGLREMRLHNRAHFYGAAANVMRRVLVDHARQRQADKRGGAAPAPAPLDAVPEPRIELRPDLVALDEALDRLAGISPEPARVVELRYFGGLSVEETADLLGIAPVTVKRRWAFARAWLFQALGGEAASLSPGHPPAHPHREAAR
jgi:RNA polymerase sigma factor (TIGR02999 family)